MRASQDVGALVVVQDRIEAVPEGDGVIGVLEADHRQDVVCFVIIVIVSVAGPASFASGKRICTQTFTEPTIVRKFFSPRV